MYCLFLAILFFGSGNLRAMELCGENNQLNEKPILNFVEPSDNVCLKKLMNESYAMRSNLTNEDPAYNLLRKWEYAVEQAENIDISDLKNKSSKTAQLIEEYKSLIKLKINAEWLLIKPAIEAMIKTNQL